MIGYSILIAAPQTECVSDRYPLRDLVGEVFIPAAEHAGVENAALNYAGTFVEENMDGTNLTLSVDEGRPGLGLQSLFVNGTDMLTSYSSVRLYPIGPETSINGHSKLLSFRATTAKSSPPRADVDGGNGGMFNSGGCTTWQEVGFTPDIDELVLEIVNGRVESVSSLLVGLTMGREK